MSEAPEALQSGRETSFEELENTDWDVCVIGNGVSSLWASHWLWSLKKNVLWITSEEPYSPERALLQHGWMWGADARKSDLLTNTLKGFQTDEAAPEFETAYFDAKSSKRFRRWGEVKQNWGEPEKNYFEHEPFRPKADQSLRDLWYWHARLHQFHDSGTSYGPKLFSLFQDPRFVRLQNWPLIEIKTSDSKVSSVVLSGLKPDRFFEIKAKNFILGDFDEPLSSFIKEKADAERLSMALKGRMFRPGFGLKLWHHDLSSALNQVVALPLVVNPSGKSHSAHIVGRFVSGPEGLQSYWISLLSDEEVEDNNEILKKIKLAKRAIDRSLPGFIESIKKESVTFEPRMRATVSAKKAVHEVLGAHLLTDYFGLEIALDTAFDVFGIQQPAPAKEIRPEESRPESSKEELWEAPPAE